MYHSGGPQKCCQSQNVFDLEEQATGCPLAYISTHTPNESANAKDLLRTVGKPQSGPENQDAEQMDDWEWVVAEGSTPQTPAAEADLEFESALSNMESHFSTLSCKEERSTDSQACSLCRERKTEGETKLP